MEDENFAFGVVIGSIVMALAIAIIGFIVVLSGDSNQETQIKELKQKIEIIELNNKLLKLKEVK